MEFKQFLTDDVTLDLLNNLSLSLNFRFLLSALEFVCCKNWKWN
jgi:hypothetical protein